MPPSVSNVQFYGQKRMSGGWWAFSFDISPRDFDALASADEFARSEDEAEWIEDPFFAFLCEKLEYVPPASPRIYVSGSGNGRIVADENHTRVFYFWEW